MEYAQEDANKIQIKSFQIFNSGQLATRQILNLSLQIIHTAMVAAA
jgi:hypothetical protein